jgi:hypothetical protein
MFDVFSLFFPGQCKVKQDSWNWKVGRENPRRFVKAGFLEQGKSHISVHGSDIYTAGQGLGSGSQSCFRPALTKAVSPLFWASAYPSVPHPARLKGLWDDVTGERT